MEMVIQKNKGTDKILTIQSGLSFLTAFNILQLHGFNHYLR